MTSHWLATGHCSTVSADLKQLVRVRELSVAMMVKIVSATIPISANVVAAVKPRATALNLELRAVAFNADFLFVRNA
jgi:hypothetical protein